MELLLSAAVIFLSILTISLVIYLDAKVKTQYFASLIRRVVDINKSLCLRKGGYNYVVLDLFSNSFDKHTVEITKKKDLYKIVIKNRSLKGRYLQKENFVVGSEDLYTTSVNISTMIDILKDDLEEELSYRNDDLYNKLG